jgi:hypothetical protein
MKPARRTKIQDNTLRFFRGIFLMAVGILGVFSAQQVLELIITGYPLSLLSAISPNEAREFINLLNSKLIQAMGVVLIAVGLAVPLTANMYSLKFLDFFIRNPVNNAVLIFVVFANLSGLWASYSLKSSVLPTFQLHLVFILTITSLLLVLPYLFYVFRFLHPDTLLQLLEKEVRTYLKAAFRQDGAVENRERVAETLEHIANISVRSVDRSDRNTAIESVLTLERVARNYWAIKKKLSPSWFEANHDFFLGFSSSAVEEMTSSRSWVEMKLFYQFFEVMRAACPRMPELTSTIAKGLRKLGLETTSLYDPALRELVIEYFNTFIRLALNRRDVRSLFIIFDQYRNFAESLNEKFPAQVLEVAYYFEYYGQVAREQQMPFVVEAVAHDLGTLVQKAWESGIPIRQTLLERFLHFDHQARPVLAGVKKAHALLASYFLEAGQTEPTTLIRDSFRGLDRAFIQTLKEDLLQVTRQKYWEVSERRMNIDFLPTPRREKLQEFFDSILKGQGGEKEPFSLLLQSEVPGKDQ